MSKDHPYTTKSTKVVYKNPWIKVREDAVVLPNGKDGIYGVMESNDSVMIAVLNAKNELYLIDAYSYPSQSWNWELPGGGGDGEEAVIASKRELAEETGIIAETWELLGKTRVCNGLMTERQSTYLARNLTMTGQKDKEDSAIIRAGKFYALDVIHRMITDGTINDNQTLTGVYLVEQWLAKNLTD